MCRDVSADAVHRTFIKMSRSVQGDVHLSKGPFRTVPVVRSNPQQRKSTMKKSLRAIIAGTVIAATAVATAGPVLAGTTLNGGGSSFVANLMNACQDYNAASVNSDGDRISYSSVGSGSGKTNFANNTYKFGATDSAYSSGAPANFVYVPLVAGSISVMYNLKGVSPVGATVRLSPQTVGDIFAGKIKMWNDPAIVVDNTSATKPAVKKGSKSGVSASITKVGSKVTITVASNASALKTFKGKKISFIRTTAKNKTSKAGTDQTLKGSVKATFSYAKGDIYTVKVGTKSIAAVGTDPIATGVTVKLPAKPIRVTYRSGTSGTTNNFTLFLNKTAPATWTKPANDSFTAAFPGSIPTDGSFQAATGSDGVANYVQSTDGAITYTELSFVKSRENIDVKSALLKNNAGLYIDPTPAATAAFYAEAPVSAEGLVTPDYTVAAADAYLLNAIAYGLGYTTPSTANTGVRKFFEYVLQTCSPQQGVGVGYAPLTGAILTKALSQVAKIGPAS